MNQLQHIPEDMTVTADASVTLADLQAALRKSRQWLPIDPPDPNLTLREILDRNESGPHRFGYGTVRDYVIGLTVKLADGRIVKSGGKVVKNVAGYDLQKLFIGSGGTLGTISEVTFKLRPIPETEKIVQKSLDSLDSANETIESIVASELTPVVFDLYRTNNNLTAVLSFDGTVEDVDWQLALAAKLGFSQTAAVDYDKSFRLALPCKKLSVLPSKLIEALRPLSDSPFVARAGNGIIFHRTDLPVAKSSAPEKLSRRLKDAFDPKHLLPELPT
jgi:FAD/FMN-containing dehydrogenase